MRNKRYSLILSSGFEPISICDVKKTIKYLVNGQGRAFDTKTSQLYTFDHWLQNFSSFIPERALNLFGTNLTEYTIKTEKLWLLIPEIIILNRPYVKRKERATICINKRVVFERDDHKCVYCHEPLTLKNRTIDHIIPVSKGGSVTNYDNVVACCRKCNHIKGDKLISELGWKINTKSLKPKISLLMNIPHNKWLISWKPYLKELSEKVS